MQLAYVMQLNTQIKKMFFEFLRSLSKMPMWCLACCERIIEEAKYLILFLPLLSEFIIIKLAEKEDKIC